MLEELQHTIIACTTSVRKLLIREMHAYGALPHGSMLPRLNAALVYGQEIMLRCTGGNATHSVACVTLS